MTDSLPVPDETSTESSEVIARDVAAIGRFEAVSSILAVVCRNTGLRFSAVARVSERSWTACAVNDSLSFGLEPGSQLELNTTLCMESRAARAPIAFDHASEDPVFSKHHTPRIYKLESYISVPIILPDGEYFGNLCALDPEPRTVSNPQTVAMFTCFAELIGLHLHAEKARAQDQAELEQKLTAELENSELREQFIAVLGHDLRGPLSAIVNHAQLLTLRTADPGSAIAGRGIMTAARRMSRLVDDLMDLARGRLGSTMALNKVIQTDIDTAINEVIAEIRATYQGRVFEVVLAMPTEPVTCDRTRVQQVVANLLNNAAVYGSPVEPVRIEAQTCDGWLSVSVWNGGQPISPEAQQQIFNPYWRPKHSAAGGGLGLGLYICEQIVSAHGGTISVQSSEGEGTRFSFCLPLDASAPAVGLR